MAEGDGLLNRYTVKSRIGGSNPPLSAIFNFSQGRDKVGQSCSLIAIYDNFSFTFRRTALDRLGHF